MNSLSFSVAQLFSRQAQAAPEALALSFGGAVVTYAELERRSNRLGHYLRGLGVGPETMVACAFERSIEMIVGLLGVLKAGGAYVPLDPGYPAARLHFMLADTAAPFLLTEPSLAPKLAPAAGGARIVAMDAARAEIDSQPATACDAGAGPESLAYVMYTSGSTGTPKGVLVENRSIVRLVRETGYCDFGPREVFLQLAPISFDASTFEIWGALLNGARLAIMPPGEFSLEQLGRTLRAEGVTTLWLTAGLFHFMVDQRVEDLRGLKQLLAGGDALSARHVRRLLEAAPEITLINGYGPTENTTFTCCHRMRAGDTIPEPVPVGRAIAGTEVVILDAGLKAVAEGEAGELCAGGAGVARGYWNDAERTAEKFITADGIGRAYRTGDRVRRREDGAIEFLGRFDDQVKINGFRIEPGEVEQVLRRHPGVRDAAVVGREDGAGGKKLAAYWVPSGDSGSAALKDYAGLHLPPYMIPSVFVKLEAMPLTANGKVDRGALPAPERAVAAPKAEASSELEERIAAIWGRTLGVADIGREDNFFDLGGDSLLLVAVHAKLQREIHSDISITDLFEHTTVRALAKYCADRSGAPSFDAAAERMRKRGEALARQKRSREVTA